MLFDLVFVDVAVHGRVPVAHVVHVDGEFVRVFGNAQVVLRENEAALLAVQREGGHAVAHGEHQRGLQTVDAVARRHLAAAGLEKVFLLHAAAFFGHVQHAEDSANAHVHLDVAGAVQRIEQQQVFALRVAVGHHVDAPSLRWPWRPGGRPICWPQSALRWR